MTPEPTVKCPLCQDDGWVDTLDHEGNPAGAMDCPHLGNPGHAPFNATGILPDAIEDAIRAVTDA